MEPFPYPDDEPIRRQRGPASRIAVVGLSPKIRRDSRRERARRARPAGLTVTDRRLMVEGARLLGQGATRS